MGEGERLSENVDEGRRERRLAFSQARLDELQVPVAELAVDEVVEREGGVGEVVGVDPAADLGFGTLEPGQDPAILYLPGPRPLGRASGPTWSRTSRAAFQSLLTNASPWAIRSSLKRTS